MNKTHAYNELDGVKLSKEKVSNLAEFIKLIPVKWQTELRL